MHSNYKVAAPPRPWPDDSHYLYDTMKPFFLNYNPSSLPTYFPSIISSSLPWLLSSSSSFTLSVALACVEAFSSSAAFVG